MSCLIHWSINHYCQVDIANKNAASVLALIVHGIVDMWIVFCLISIAKGLYLDWYVWGQIFKSMAFTTCTIFRSGIRSVNLENPSFQHEIPFASILVHLEMLTKMDIKEQYEQIRNNPADASTFEAQRIKRILFWNKRFWVLKSAGFNRGLHVLV